LQQFDPEDSPAVTKTRPKAKAKAKAKPGDSDESIYSVSDAASVDDDSDTAVDMTSYNASQELGELRKPEQPTHRSYLIDPRPTGQGLYSLPNLAALTTVEGQLSHDDNDVDYCGLCGMLHGDGVCPMTNKSENLAEFRRMLLSNVHEESIEDRVGFNSCTFLHGKANNSSKSLLPLKPSRAPWRNVANSI
jgi:chromodomain-helicase-DNA-binding protein 4